MLVAVSVGQTADRKVAHWAEQTAAKTAQPRADLMAETSAVASVDARAALTVVCWAGSMVAPMVLSKVGQKAEPLAAN